MSDGKTNLRSVGIACASLGLLIALGGLIAVFFCLNMSQLEIEQWAADSDKVFSLGTTMLIAMASTMLGALGSLVGVAILGKAKARDTVQSADLDGLTCPKCGAELERGFLNGHWFRIRWTEEPDKITVFGAEQLGSGGFVTAPKLAGSRCRKCQLGVFSYRV